MKAIRYVTIFVLIVLLSSSCGRIKLSSHRTGWTVDELLRRDNYIIPDSLFSFFPSVLDSSHTLECLTVLQNASKNYDFEVDGFVPYDIIELYRTKDVATVRSMLDRYLDSSISTVDAGDTTYHSMMVYYYAYLTFEKSYLREVLPQNTDAPIVPFFHNIADYCGIGCEETQCELIPGTKILTLMSGTDSLLAPEYCYAQSSLPAPIRHGYRSGIAAHPDSCYILYWTVVW